MWDFVAQVRKTHIQESRSQQIFTDESDRDKDEDFELEQADNFDDAAIEIDNGQCGRPTSIDQLLKSHTCKWWLSSTHMLKWKHTP